MASFFRLHGELQSVIFDMLDFADRRARCFVAVRAGTGIAKVPYCVAVRWQPAVHTSTSRKPSSTVPKHISSCVGVLTQNSQRAGLDWPASAGPSTGFAPRTLAACGSTHSWSYRMSAGRTTSMARAAVSPGTPAPCEPSTSASRCALRAQREHACCVCRMCGLDLRQGLASV